MELLCRFIDKNWKKDHIFVLDRQLLDWQHKDICNKRYNFVVAYNTQTKTFDAILGFMPTSHFDDHLIEYNEIWLAIWKVRETEDVKVSGLQLLFYLTTKLKPKTIASVGITENVKGIYDALKYKRGILSHYYIKSKFKESSIAIVYPANNNSKCKNIINLDIIDILKYRDEIDQIFEKSSIHPKKSFTFVKNRYLDHASYEYKYIGLFIKDEITAVLVTRKIFVGKSSCIRIVDWIGDFLTMSIYANMQDILRTEGAEYIDLLVESNNKNFLIDMGFSSKSKDEIIPEYFEPYEQKNVDIEYAYKAKFDNFRIMKGDSDQDRPSHVSIRED